MDVLFFLKERTRLIAQYYELATQPFTETIRKIDAEEDPFIPQHSEHAEPAFVTEWIEATEMLEITGRSCVSMLSASLQLYFRTWERELGISCSSEFGPTFKREGLIGGYRHCFATWLGIDWSTCPADLEIIEQVVLARNRDQHPENITTVRATHADKDWRRFSRPFFMDERELDLLDDNDGSQTLMSPSLHVPRDKLMIAVEQVEVLCEWLEGLMFQVKYPPR